MYTTLDFVYVELKYNNRSVIWNRKQGTILIPVVSYSCVSKEKYLSFYYDKGSDTGRAKGGGGMMACKRNCYIQIALRT